MVTTTSLPVLLIPGLACTPSLYAGQMPALWTFGPVTVADHRRADSMDAIARQILAEAPPRFALAGLSMGGYIALAIMRLAPDRVAKLALLDTGSRSDTPEASERRKASMAKVQAGEFDAVMDTLWPILVHKDRQGDAALKRIVFEMAKTAGADAFVSQQQAIMTRPDSRPDLPRYQMSDAGAGGRGRSTHAARLVRGDGGAHSEQPAGEGAGQRTSLDTGKAGSGDEGAGGMDGELSGDCARVRRPNPAAARARRHAACRYGRSG